MDDVLTNFDHPSRAGGSNGEKPMSSSQPISPSRADDDAQENSKWLKMDCVSKPFRASLTRIILFFGRFSLNHRMATLLAIAFMCFVTLIGTLRFRFQFDYFEGWCPKSGSLAGNICDLRQDFHDSFGYPYEVLDVIVSSDSEDEPEKEGDLALHLDQLYSIYEAVTGVTAEYKNQFYRYEDLCQRGETIFGTSTCMITSSLDFYGLEYGPSLLETIQDDTEPHVTLSNNETRTIFGSLVRPDLYLANTRRSSNETLEFVSAGSMTFRLTPEPTLREAHRAWQLEVNKVLANDFQLEGGWRHSHRSSYTVDYELAWLGIPDAWPLLTTIAVMIVFVVATIGKHPRSLIKSRAWVGIGVLNVVVPLALIGVKGLLLSVGEPFNMFTPTSAFFLVALGVDDVFVFVHEFDRRFDDNFIRKASNKELMQAVLEALETVGLAVTFTSFTDVAVFWLGMMTPFLTIRQFFLDLGLTMLALWLFFIVLSPIFLYWDLIRQRANIPIYSLFAICKEIKTQPAQAEEMGDNAKESEPIASESDVELDKTADKLKLRSTSINGEDPDDNNEIKNEGVAYQIGKVMENTHLQVFIMTIFLLCLAICSYAITQLEEKQLFENQQRTNSYAVQYNSDIKKFYGGFADPMDIHFTDMSNFYRPEVQREAISIALSMVETDYSLGTAPRASMEQFWLSTYTQWIQSDFGNASCTNTSSATTFSACVAEFLETPIYSNFGEHLYFEDGILLESRFFVQISRVQEPYQYPDVYRGLKEVLEKSSESTSLADSVRLVGDVAVLGRCLDYLYEWTLQSLGTALLGCAALFLLFLPVDEAVVAIIASVSILTYTMGLVSIFNIYIDYVALVVCSMIAGFLVDYVAHVSEVFTRARERGERRISQVLPEVMKPVVLGGTTTVLGVLPILMVPSPGYHGFTKIASATVVCGVAISIFVLPIVYSRKPSCSSEHKASNSN